MKLSNIKLEFNERPIYYKEFADYKGKDLTGNVLELWKNRMETDRDFSDIMMRMYRRNTNFGRKFLHENATPNTVVANDQNVIYSKPIETSVSELCCIGSFPLDYDFLNIKPKYLIGMSVPPIMMAQVSYEVYNQLLK